jgi:hypothetical protein
MCFPMETINLHYYQDNIILGIVLFSTHRKKNCVYIRIMLFHRIFFNSCQFLYVIFKDCNKFVAYLILAKIRFFT